MHLTYWLSARSSSAILQRGPSGSSTEKVSRCTTCPKDASDLDHDRDDHGPASHLLVEELAERIPDGVLEHLPFGVAAARFVDGVEHLLPGRLQQRIGGLLVNEAAGDKVRAGDDLAGVLVHRHDHDKDAVLR